MYEWLALLETSTLYEMWEDLTMAYAPNAPESEEVVRLLNAIDSELFGRV